MQITGASQISGIAYSFSILVQNYDVQKYLWKAFDGSLPTIIRVT